jgi:hypothetical protein
VPARFGEPSSEAQVRPPLEDAVGVDVVDDDELRPARRPGDQADVPTRDVQLLRQQAQQGLVRRPLDRRRGDARAQDPIGNALDAV